MSPGARVSMRTYPIWRLRLRRGLPRYLLIAVSALGLAASARYAIAPPRPARVSPDAGAAPVLDRAAEAYAVLFARRYLTWSASEAPAEALERWLGAGQEAGAGLTVPEGVSQAVAWAEVVQSREPARGQHVYTVAAQTDASGLLYLTVGVTRRPSGVLSLSGYPAFVGPPASAPASMVPAGPPIGEPALEVVVRRALGNYLSGSGSELAADLTAGAQVSLPPNRLQLDSVGHPSWAQGSAVQVTAQASDARGVRYTLSYELDVARVRGRWEISAIQTDPLS